LPMLIECLLGCEPDRWSGKNGRLCVRRHLANNGKATGPIL